MGVTILLTLASCSTVERYSWIFIVGLERGTSTSFSYICIVSCDHGISANNVSKNAPLSCAVKTAGWYTIVPPAVRAIEHSKTAALR